MPAALTTVRSDVRGPVFPDEATGLAVRESAAHLDKDSSGEKYLRMGVDLVLCDAPEKVLQAVLEIYGADYLSKPGETIDRIFRTYQKTPTNH